MDANGVEIGRLVHMAPLFVRHFSLDHLGEIVDAWSCPVSDLSLWLTLLHHLTSD